MKIAVLGGSFDPPHVGHLLVAQTVKKLLNIDHVWLMPIYTHPFSKPLSPAKDRLTMVELMKDDVLAASDFAIQKKLTHPIDILKNLTQTYSQHSFYWISGSDQIKNYPKWKNWPELITAHKLIIYPRSDERKTIERAIIQTLGIKEIPQNLLIFDPKDLPTMDISSITIQEKIKQNEPIRGLVTKKVELYIKENRLYYLDPETSSG